MNIIHELMRLNERARQATARELAHGALVRVLLAKVLTNGPYPWRVAAADLKLATRYEVMSMDLSDLALAGETEAMRDEVRNALAGIMDEMESAIASAERAGILSAGTH